MDVWCNQKIIFYKNPGIDFNVWLCKGYEWYVSPVLLRISILLPGTFGIFTLPPAGWKRVAVQRFNSYQKLYFFCRSNKKVMCCYESNLTNLKLIISIFHLFQYDGFLSQTTELVKRYSSFTKKNYKIVINICFCYVTKVILQFTVLNLICKFIDCVKT